MPVLNPSAFQHSTRNTPLDDKNLNRVFPGKQAGTPTERLAQRIYTSFAASQPDVLIDLHTISMRAVPFIILDRATGTGAAELDMRTWELAQSSGLITVYDDNDPSYRERKLDQSFTAIAQRQLQIPALTVELGPTGIVMPTFRDMGLQATLNIVHSLGMTEWHRAAPADPAFRSGLSAMNREAAVAVEHAGLVEFLIEPGVFFTAGQPVAHIRSSAGDVVEETLAPFDGFALCLRNRGAVYPGYKLLVVGRPVSSN